MTAPSSSTNRVVQLDALRGLAVIGIVWMNVYVFALPSQAYYNPIVWGADTALDRAIWAASFVFVEDKFRTLFAMLFGAGCLILLERSETNKWRAHFARMAVLFAIGIAHSVLLASNDILRVYALAGLALPFLAHLSARDLYAIAIGLVVLHCGAGLMLFGGGVADYYAGRFAGDAYLSAERDFGSDEAALRYMVNIGNEGFADRVARRIPNIPDQLTFVAASIPLNLAAITLGMALWKDRMLAGEWRTFMLQRLAAVCALIAILALLGLVWWVSSNGFPGALVGAAALLFSAPFDMLLALSYAALAMAFFAPGRPATRLLAAVGRLALTNYLMTSVMLAAIFASWGFGLFGEVSRSVAFAFSFVPIIAVLIWSPLWLRAFGQGPAERLWRGGARLLS